MTPSRDNILFAARAYHAVLREKMHNGVWGDFWWTMFEWAQNKRRKLQAIPKQRDLFGDADAQDD